MTGVDTRSSLVRIACRVVSLLTYVYLWVLKVILMYNAFRRKMSVVWSGVFGIIWYVL